MKLEQQVVSLELAKKLKAKNLKKINSYQSFMLEGITDGLAKSINLIARPVPLNAEKNGTKMEAGKSRLKRQTTGERTTLKKPRNVISYGTGIQRSKQSMLTEGFVFVAEKANLNS